MKLSIVIPAYGRQELLIRCLESLKADFNDFSDFTADIDCEICVVDDGSGLDADSIQASVAIDSLIWKAFDAPKNRAAARNEGVRSTTGEIIIFLDSDMEVSPGFLRAHHDSHLSHPQTAVIGEIDWPTSGAFHRYIGSRGVKKLSPGETVPPWYFVTGNASVRRSDLPDQKHPFDDALPGWGGEDLALGMALSKNGVSFMYASDARSYHHFDGDLAGHVQRTYRYGEEALPIIVQRFPELASVLRLDLTESQIWRMLVSAVFRRPLIFLAGSLDFLPLPDKLFDYLTFASYAAGYLKR